MASLSQVVVLVIAVLNVELKHEMHSNGYGYQAPTLG